MSMRLGVWLGVDEITPFEQDLRGDSRVLIGLNGREKVLGPMQGALVSEVAQIECGGLERPSA